MTLADTQAIAILTGRKASTIRSWAHRGLIQRQGTRGGRALYDCDAARALADFLDNAGHAVQHQHHSRTTAPERNAPGHLCWASGLPDAYGLLDADCPVHGPKPGH